MKKWNETLDGLSVKWVEGWGRSACSIQVYYDEVAELMIAQNWTGGPPGNRVALTGQEPMPKNWIFI